MTANALPVSRVVQVSVNLTPPAAQGQNLSNLLVLGNSPVIDVVERYRSYASLSAVAADFGSTAPEYYAAALWFSQAPQPTTLLVGRWAQTATAAVLRCATLSAAAQLLSAWTAIANGSFTVSINGTPTNVTGLNFSGAVTLSGVAATITAALTGVTCVWNAAFQRFEFTTTLTGSGASLSFLTPEGVGTDISGLLGGTAASSGAYVANGVVAETAASVATTFDNNYGQAWYALVMPTAVDADHLAVAAFIEGTTNKHVYGVTTQEAGALVASFTTDIAYELSQLGYKKTLVQYSSSSAYAVCSLLGRILTTDYTGNNTVITLAFKSEPGVVAEQLNSTQANSLAAKNCNAFLAFNNNTSIILNGVTSSGIFADVVLGTDWLAIALQTAAYNALYTSTTKIPQTDAGMHLLTVTFEAVCSQAVTNGLLAPGVWNSGGFGILNQGDFLAKGFYVYAPLVASQNASDRAARKSVPFQIAAKLAGAVHDISIAVSVNQ